MSESRAAGALVLILAWCFHVQAQEVPKPLTGFPRAFWVHKEKPQDVTDIEYDRLFTQIELRLRNLNFVVRSGNSSQYIALTQAANETGTTGRGDSESSVRPHLQDICIELTVNRNGNLPILYSAEVVIRRGVLISSIDGNYVIYRRGENGERDIPGSRARLIVAEIYSSNATFGVANDWSTVANAVLAEVDEFANDWLAANPK